MLIFLASVLPMESAGVPSRPSKGLREYRRSIGTKCVHVRLGNSIIFIRPLILNIRSTHIAQKEQVLDEKPMLREFSIAKMTRILGRRGAAGERR